jgi:hypothetical protein
MDEPTRFDPIRILPAAAMLALHALAMAISTRMLAGQSQEIWTGYHIAAALAQVASLSIGTRPGAKPLWGTLLWTVPAIDLVATVVLALVLGVL